MMDENKSKNKRYFTYILRCSDNSLYTGITSDVKRRMREHFSKSARAAKYTKSHTPVKLEAVWECESKELAARLEYNIKQLTKQQKESLLLTGSLEALANKVTAEEYSVVEIKGYLK